ncbi:MULTISPECIES: 30S ribosomal protein S6 [Crateriforma]|uniref:Small ribosomal subunit protein bS6 n=1 Tax=Crateriforma conspicua TaxID=2527996 RepID=A0A5C6FUA5_9PLAN|nr:MULTISPECIES: 30S ribosomal protein S6 [Crateriforma]TWU65946.1 30S ribosomal protein S6 [Crateriforma conspicua]
MANNTYETLLILDSNHYARDPGGVAKRVEEVVTAAGGEVHVNRLWMEQKLAYPINGHQKGTYWLVYFSGEGDVVAKTDRGFHLDDAVVRHLTIRLDPRLVEPILANARGERVVGADSDEAGDSESGDTPAPAAAEAPAEA